MEDKWYYALNGKQTVPVSKEVLLTKIKPETLVYTKRIGKWVRASEVPELGLEAPPLPLNETGVSKKKETSPLVLMIMFVMVPALFLGFIIYVNYINSDEYKKDREGERLRRGLGILFGK